ncbi:MAG: pyridoxal phosphate-dependent aminotransferase [Bradymonadales bacterium]|nr:pyridoxal phosphate-dependent aminotransferase [Bradymonadales bacterium]
MTLSKIARSVGDSPTLKLNATASALKAKGEPVIHLGGGEPEGKAPPEAIESAINLLGTGEVRYTPAAGIPALRKAIADFTEQHYGQAVTTDQVIASAGAKQAIMVCLQAIIDPNDEVIFPAPYWVSYPDMVKLVGGIPVVVRPPAGTFQPRIGDIERLISPATKAIIINSPNNPSGTMYSPEFVAELVGLCQRRDLYLVSDDIYHGLVFDGKRPANCLAFSSRPLERSKLVLINGVSKQYAMTGFRIGWAVAHKELIGAMANIQAHQTSGPSIVGQQASLAALRGDQSTRDNLCQVLERHRDLLVEKLSGIEGITYAVPEGTFYCFPDFSAYDPSSDRLARFLLEKVKVVTVPGSGFGMDGHLRISFCGSMQGIEEGVERIRWALDPDAPGEITVGKTRLVKDW